MFPLSTPIGGVQLHVSLLFFTVLSLIIGAVLAEREYQRLKLGDIHRNRLFWAIGLPLVFVVSSLAAFVFHVGTRDLLLNLHLAFAFGFSSFGALLTLFALAALQARFYKEQPGKRLDWLASILPLTLAIYRVGCLLNGCCFGEVTDGPLGLYLPDEAGVWAQRYPTQILLALFDLALFTWLWRRRDHKAFHGQLTIHFFIFFGLGRFLIDGLRDLPAALGPLNLLQLIAFCIFAIAAYTAYEFRASRAGL